MLPLSNSTALARPLAAAAAVLALLAAAGCADSRSAKPPAAPRAAVVGVLTLQPEPVTLSTELLGRTSAPLVAEIRPQVGGIVQARRFTEGQRVQAGQTLYQIDPASYRAALASAEAALAKAQATEDAARLTAERRAELLRAEAVSRQDLQDAQAAQRQAQADVAAARAAVETARINLARTTLSSPIAGRVDVSTVTPGALVTAEQATALTTVRQTDPMQVDIPQSSAELLRLQAALGQGGTGLQAAAQDAPVTLLLEDGSRYPLAGRLSVRGVSVNAGTGAVTLRAVFPNPQGRLLPGMAVRAVLPTAQAPAALLLPQQAVQRDAAGRASVLLVDAGNVVRQRTVVADQAVGQRWLVAQGLAAGERVVVEGALKVKPGDTVQAQPVAAAPGTSAPAVTAPAAAASAPPAAASAVATVARR